MQQPEHVAVFWDFENLPPRSGVPGCETVQAIRSLAHGFGIITSFKAYLEISPSLGLWSDLQASGVALVDCPHRGRAGAASKMLLVDMITFAIDHPAPATILLISDDRDLAYAVSTLRHRKFKVVLLCPADAPGSLVAQADAHFDWNAKVLRGSQGDELPLAPSPAPQRVPHLSTSINKVTSDSDRKGKDREINNADLRTSHCDNQSNSYNNHHEHTLPNTTNLCPTPSRTTSPAGILRSPESSARTFSPLPKHKPINGDIVPESSSQQDHRKGFPFLGNETWKESRDVQSSTSTATVKPSPLAYTSPSAPLLGASNFQKPSAQTLLPAALATPAATPSLSTISEPVPVPTVFATPPANTGASHASHKSILQTPATLAQPHSQLPPPPRPAAVGPAPSHFLPLINALQKRAREQKRGQVMRTDLGGDLAKVQGLYAQAKVSKFASYILLAEDAGIITSGGSGNMAWVSLRPEWTSSSIFPS